MKNKFALLSIIFSLIFTLNLFSQEKDKLENINIKGLSQADMERLFGDLYKPGKVFKTAGDPREIGEVIISGNKITTVVFNYGSICKPNYLANVADLVWNGLGYGFEFGPLATAQIIQPNNNGGFDTTIIVDDSFVLTTQGGYSPDRTLKWGWLPKPGYKDPNSTEIARLNAPDKNGDGKPDSWPDRWYLPGAGKYVWPAFLGDQATAPDEEVYYVIDDFTNQAYVGNKPYYPFNNDSTKRGLGLDNEVRILQFNNPLAEDILFLVYQITNTSDKDLKRVYFGMHGDPHIGGSNNANDDRSFFIPPLGSLAEVYPQRARNMVYGWDDDMKGDGGKQTGYFGWKFLESPSNALNGFDDDDDGITDETPDNGSGTYIDGVTIPLNTGISDLEKYTKVYGAPKPRWSGDEDGDWDPSRDDIGIDGIGPTSPNYPGPDFGEGDGMPSQAWYLDNNNNNKYDVGEPISTQRIVGYKWAGSEPNFGLRDISESDQIGLTSFHSAIYTNSLPNVPKNISLMWEWLSSEYIDPNQELFKTPGDNIFNFGTGPLKLDRGETQRFSMCILFGDNLNDLVLNAETSTRILEADYRFAQPPLKPIVSAVPGDKRVTLYWDTRAEGSVDPLTGAKDFQGYKIYRSRDYTFSDVYTITDGNGVPFLGQALFDPNSGKRAQFDLDDSLSGYFPVEYMGRAVKYYIGDNTGLVHEYVDSTVLNGITYYYAVVSYDSGLLEEGLELPPSESQSVIQRDPITSELKFDVNTVEVTPNAIASGIASAEISAVKQEGDATGKVIMKVLDDKKVKNKIYKLDFIDDNTFNVVDSLGVVDNFVANDTVFVNLAHINIIAESFQLFDKNNNLVSSDKYYLDFKGGKIRGISQGNLGKESYTAKYKYYPVFESKYINGEDANSSFDGLRVYLFNDELNINHNDSKFSNPDINAIDTIYFPPRAGTGQKYRADWEIRFNDLDTSNGNYVYPGDTVTNQLNRTVVTPFRIWDVTNNVKANYLINESDPALRNSKWDWGEGIVLRPMNATGNITSYEVVLRKNPDTTKQSILPKNGDIYFVKTYKPFNNQSGYEFHTKPIEFKSDIAKNNLNDIYVVPNPYVAYSLAENPGRTPSMRGDKELQFRNLPPKCTIRIYTITGELVQTIQKDDLTSSASWDLLSNEGQRVAYGVYLYHVDAPGVGEKIGRFAVIK